MGSGSSQITTASPIADPDRHFLYSTSHDSKARANVYVVRRGKKYLDKSALACFAVIFTPQLFLFHYDFALNGVLKSVAMIGLLVLLVRYPFPDPEWPIATVESA